MLGICRPNFTGAKLNFSYLQTLIEGAHYTLFYDIALHYLCSRGYKNPEIRDGKNDKGTDVTVEGSSANIQLSVRKDWKAKVNEEAARYAQGDHFIYITSRRVPKGDEEDFIAGSEYKKKGLVTFEIVDSQKLASLLVRTDRAKLVCELLGAPWQSGNFTIKESATASLLLFSAESKNIRTEYVKWLVRSSLMNAPCSKDELISKILSAQGLPDSAHAQISGTIDKLVQAGDIVRQKDHLLTLSESSKNHIVSARSNFNGVLLSLNDHVRQLVNNIDNQDADAIAQLAIERASLLSKERKSQYAIDDFPQTARIDAILKKYGIVDIVKIEEFYRDLSSHRSFQIYGMSNVVDDVLKLNKSDLFASLMAKGQINFYLDASVAIPMILSLLYRKGSGRYSFVGAAIYGELNRLRLPLFIPDVYIEEIAAHAHLALDAFNEDKQIAGVSADGLQNSRNAFVSHFSRFTNESTLAAFHKFLSDFDIRAGVAKERNINNAKVMITNILAGYGINPFKTVQLGNIEIQDFLKSVRNNVDPILINHDARVIRTIRELPPEQKNVVCSWDSGLRQYSQENSGVFECFAPPVIMDVLNFIHDDYSEDRPNFNVLDAFLLDIEPDVQRISGLSKDLQEGTDIIALRIKKGASTRD